MAIRALDTIGFSIRRKNKQLSVNYNIDRHEISIASSKGILKSAASQIASLTYESGPYEYSDFPQTDEIVYLLGHQYSALYDIEELRHDVLSRLWFTYRRNFSPIGGMGPTCDAGWGCMLRCGQMMLAQALCMLHLGRDWRWRSGDKLDKESPYMNILRLFLDRKNSYYSIHQIASMGVTEGKVVGQWYGPNTVAQVLKKLSVYDEWSSLAIHVALDNTIIEDDIRSLCMPSSRSQPSKTNCSSPTAGKTVVNGESYDQATPPPSRTLSWKPLFLVIPLRLGLSEINYVYVDSLKTCLSFKQSIGIIGGKPNHALWFIGYVGDEIVYLDPHTTQPCVDPDPQRISDDSFHCPHACRMRFTDLDPSLALGFFCKTEQEFEDLCRSVYKEIINPHKLPMFELHKVRPPHWPTYIPGAHMTKINPAEYHMVRTSDTEEEFELL